jgi:hypothetical protein
MKPGRKTACNADNAREFLAYLSLGLSVGAAIEGALGMTRRTAATWLARSRADADAGLVFDSIYRLDDFPAKGSAVWFHEAAEMVRDGKVRVTKFHGAHVPDRQYKHPKDTPRFTTDGEAKHQPPDPEEIARREEIARDYLPPPEPQPEWARPDQLAQWAKPQPGTTEGQPSPMRRDLEARLADIRQNGPRHPRPGQDSPVVIYGRNEAADVEGEANQPARPS